MGQLDHARVAPEVKGLPTSHLCTMEGEPHLELEIQRFENGRGTTSPGDPEREGWVTIACAPDTEDGREHLETVARLIRMRSGKTFRESVKLDHVDEHGDVDDVEYLRDRPEGEE